MKTFEDATVPVSVLLSLVVAPRVLARRPDAFRAAGRCVPPLVALAAVTGLVYLNQVLFTVYVLRVHGGDASFIVRYLPADWFELAGGNPVLRLLAESFPAPSLLASSVLRVQAFLELPFVLLAFATVPRWRRSRTRPCSAPSNGTCTTRTPSTTSSYGPSRPWSYHRSWPAWPPVTPPSLARLSAFGLLLFISSLAALGVLVLTGYDTALLYNLGRLADRAAIAAGGVAAFTALRLTAARLRSRPRAGPAVTFVGRSLRRWLAFFFVPALAVRYGVNFGTPELAAGAGLLIAATGGGYALWDTLAEGRGERRDRRLLVLLGQLGCAVLAGAGAAYAAFQWTINSYYEAGLLRAMAAFLGTAIGVCVLTDAGLRRRNA